MAAFQYQKMSTRELEIDFLQGHIVTGSLGWALKLKISRFRLGDKKKFFTVDVVRHLHMVLREIVGASFLKVFRKSLGGALSNQV